MKYCPSCGKTVDTNAAFCKECGASLRLSAGSMETNHDMPNQAFSNASSNGTTQRMYGGMPTQAMAKKKSAWKIVLIVVGAVAVLLVAIFIFLAVIGSKVSFLTVDDVKESRLLGYEWETVEDALEDYFEDCSWDSYVDDTGDYIIDIVEFTGYDAYDQKVVIHFSYSYEEMDWSDETEYVVSDIWVDDVPLSSAEQDAMIYSIYADQVWTRGA